MAPRKLCILDLKIDSIVVSVGGKTLNYFCHCQGGGEQPSKTILAQSFSFYSTLKLSFTFTQIWLKAPVNMLG